MKTKVNTQANDKRMQLHDLSQRVYVEKQLEDISIQLQEYADLQTELNKTLLELETTRLHTQTLSNVVLSRTVRNILQDITDALRLTVPARKYKAE